MNPRADSQLPKPPRSDDTRIPTADTIRAAVKVTYTCEHKDRLKTFQALILRVQGLCSSSAPSAAEKQQAMLPRTRSQVGQLQASQPANEAQQDREEAARACRAVQFSTPFQGAAAQVETEV